MAQTTIGSSVFTVQPLSGERSFLLQPQIMPAISEFFSLYALFTDTMLDLMDGGARQEIEPEELLKKVGPTLERFSPIVERLCKKLPKDALQEIIRTLLEGSTMDGILLYSPQGNAIDIKLQGRTLDFWRLLIFALQTSYPDFFALFSGLRAPAKGAESLAA